MEASTRSKSGMLPAPRQERSRKTLRQILDAFEKALQTRTFEDITVGELCRDAGCSVGAFYARVQSKDGLLEHLRDRIYAEAEQSLAAMFDPDRPRAGSLSELLAAQCAGLVDLHRQRRGVIRAVFVEARRNSAFAEYTKDFNDAVLHRVARTWLAAPCEITHPEPTLAADQAALMVAGYLREAIVFAELWPAAAAVDRDTHIRELHRMLMTYLTGGPGPQRNPHA
jgi:AcrR family transcriptional regulator